MVELQLSLLEEHLRRGARRLRCWGWFAAALGAGLQVLVWTNQSSLLERGGASLFLASFTLVPGALLLSRGMGKTLLSIDRLRRDPGQLCALTLQWVRGAGGLHGQLAFQFRGGQRCYFKLPAELARGVFHALSTAFPSK